MESDKKAKKDGTTAYRGMTSAIVILVVASAALAAVCIYFSHLLQGATILLCDTGIIGMMLIMSAERKHPEAKESGRKAKHDSSNSKKIRKPSKRFNAGLELISAKDADCCLARRDGETVHDTGTVVFGSNGIKLVLGKHSDGYAWTDVMAYQVGEGFVTVKFCDGATLTLHNLTKLKVNAITERLAKVG